MIGRQTGLKMRAASSGRGGDEKSIVV